MKPYQDIPLRRARDRMIDLLFPARSAEANNSLRPFEPAHGRIGVSIRDLPVAYQRKTPFGQAVTIYLLGGQASMIYTLCDKAGIPIEPHGARITGNLVRLADIDDTALEEVFDIITTSSIYPEKAANSIPVSSPDEQAAFLQTWPELVRLTTPEIVEDGTYTILATPTDQTGMGFGISEYLHEPVVLWVGLKTDIPTRFIEPRATDQLQAADRILTIDYDQPNRHGELLKVELSGCQEHTYYQVLEVRADGSRIARSEAVRSAWQSGDQEISLTLELNGAFTEDQFLVVRAFKDLKKRDVEDILEAVDLAYPLEIWVRPDPTVPFTLTSQPLPFGETPTIAFDGSPGAQASVTYELCALPLRLSYTYEQASATYSPTGHLRVGAFATFFGLFSERFLNTASPAWATVDPEESLFVRFSTALLHQFQAELENRNQLDPSHPECIVNEYGELLPAAISAFFIGLLHAIEVPIYQSNDEGGGEYVSFHPYDLIQADGRLKEEVMNRFFDGFDQGLRGALSLGDAWNFFLRSDYSLTTNTFNSSLIQLVDSLLQRTDGSDSLDENRFLQGNTYAILFNAFYPILFGDQEPTLLLKGTLTLAGNQVQSISPEIPLEEDHLFLIKATKANGTWLFLEQVEVVLVEPDRVGPNLYTKVDPESGKLQIVLNNPQRRVGYQLREIAGVEIGPTMLPGEDRGIGWEAHDRKWGMRLRDTPEYPPVRTDLSTIFGDIEVASPGQDKGSLFSGDYLEFVPIVAQDGQEFEVLLIKEYSGVVQILKKMVVFRPTGRRVWPHKPRRR